MSKLYGAVLAGVRKALDAQKKRGERIDGIIFAGNESKRDATRATEGLFGANQKQRIYNSDEYDFLDAPFLRFKGGYREQETFFIRDPSGNAIEIKTMKVPESLWDTNS